MKVEAKKLREKAVVRLICIIAGSIMVAFLVPLAARARSTPPRPVEAPVRSAEWSGWQQVSLSEYNKGMHFSPALAAQGDKVYTMWSRQVGTGDEDFDPHYNFSASNGDDLSWGQDLNIQSTPFNTTDTTSLDMAFDSTGVPHFVWAENTKIPYSYTLYYSSTHISAIQVITQANALLIPVIAVGSSQVHVAWSQGKTDIMYNSKAIDTGGWGPAANVRSTSAVQDPNIAVDGGTVHVVWSEGDDPLDTDIKYKNSNNWPGWSGAPATVYEGSVNGYGMGYRPDIVAKGNNVYVVWCAYKRREPDKPETQEQRVLFAQSTDGGINWSGSELISGDALAANATAPTYLRPGIAVDTNGKIHVAFNGSTGGVGATENIFYVSRTQEGKWRPRQPVTLQGGQYNNTTPAIATSGEYVHLIWARQNMSDPTSRYNVFYSRASALESIFLPIIMRSY